ncbi:sigma-54 dependent transcriptional regulator [Desulfothermus naphthae]
MGKKILVIDDEKKMRRILQLLLEKIGYKVATAKDGREGIETWLKWQPDVVLTDLKMPEMDGMEILKFKNKAGLKAPLIILTAYGTIPSAVEAIKQGAFDYLTKPFDNKKVREVISRALENSPGKDKISQKDLKIVGTSAAIRQIIEDMTLVANTDTSVLITGESGTGKGLVARGIHKLGNRRRQPFVKVNCAAIPANLLESELFGHKKGAFTGAVDDRKGRFVEADRGVLFLDEIGDLPLSMQPKLLNAVEEKIVTPVGSTKPIKCDVKIICATNQDLLQMIEQGRFRQDLHYRLNTFHIHIPPLRERAEDIPLLVEYFLEQFCKSFGQPTLSIEPKAMDLFLAYHWPGNVRELKNTIERVVLKCKGPTIRAEEISLDTKGPEDLSTTTSISELDMVEHEKRLIIQALNKTGGNQVRAAKLLGITRNTLRYRMKKYGIKRV